MSAALSSRSLDSKHRRLPELSPKYIHCSLVQDSSQWHVPAHSHTSTTYNAQCTQDEASRAKD